MQTYRFGDFELDIDAQQLRLRGDPVRLERRPLDLLILLVSRHGHVVSREEIIAALWPANVIIDFDSGLNTLARKVRNALGDSSEQPLYIETVSGRGYRFIGKIEPITNPAPEQPAAAPATKAPQSRYIAVLVLSLLAIGGMILFGQTDSLAPEQTSIAVFPFENLTGNDELAYLASGIAEETSMSLARIDMPNLRVIGGVSTRALADSARSIAQIGRDLNVDFVVLSSLRLDKSRIRVTSRLLRVANDEQVWSASFDRELTNVLGLQRELSIAIAEQIRLRLSPDVSAAISLRQTRNPVAYDLYLKGRQEWMQFLPDSIPRALDYYQQAVDEDPGYALAWAGIAHAIITSTVTIEADRESVRAEAQDALQRALEFGPELAETQLALGSFSLFLDQDQPSAEAAARRAVSLDPNSAMCNMFLGMVLSQRDEHVEARAMMRRARELDPLFPLMFANSAFVSLQAGDPAEAVEFATQAIAINPEFWVGYLHLGNAQIALGDYEAAVQTFANAERLSGNNTTRATAARAFILAKLGRTDEARDALAELLSRSTERYVPPYYIAVIYAGLGDVDSAFDWLNRGLSLNKLSCLSLTDDPKLEILRADLRFESLLRLCALE
jgi:TolB-like protein/DNA-binding winged helix-turn-helix (wHTH) protein/Flp pilus assembly protein TadD